METFSKGLVQDTTLKTQIDGSYRFALNAVLETREDGGGAIANEIGNDLSASLPTSFLPIGYSLTDSDDIIIFAASDAESLIGLFNPVTKTFTSVVRNSCLGFSQDKPIQAQFRIRKGCNRTVYFTDNYNPYRFFDFDDQSIFQTSDGDWDCNKFAFFPLLDVPVVESVEVIDQGGELLVGSYSFAIRYLDSDLNPTNFFYTTRPVNIYDDPIGGDYDQIDGAVNSTGEEGQLGAVPLTSKSIELTLTGMDLDFRYFQLAVIVASEGIGSVSNVYLLPAQEISAPSIQTTVSTLTGAGTELTTLDDVAVDAPVFSRIKTHTQLHNRLFIGGVTTPEYDWASFQAAANVVEVTWSSETVDGLPDEDSPFLVGNAKHPSTPYEKMTFTADEVYALGVEFLLNNGTWTPTFHIPGKEATTSDLTSWTVGTHISEEDTAHLGLSTGEVLPKWRLVNTASEPYLAYHESAVDYPSVTCNGVRVFPEGKIRHHRMPCRTQVPIYEMDGDNVKLNVIKLTFSGLTYPHTDVVGHRWVSAKRQDSDTTVIDTALLIGPSFPYVTDDDPNDSKTEFSGLFQSEDGADETTDLFRILSPRQILSYPTPRGTYVKFLGKIVASNIYQFGWTFDVSGSNTNGRSNTFRREFLTDIASVSYLYRNIEQQLNIAIRSEQAVTSGLTFPLVNYSYSNPYRVIQLSTELTNWIADTVTLQYNLSGGDEPTSSTTVSENTNQIYMVALKKISDPFSNLSALTYVPLHSSPLSITDPQVVYGDAYITEFNYFDIHSKSQIEEGSIRFDVFASNALARTFLESKVNYDLRHEGDDTCNRIYKVTEHPQLHLINKVATPDGTAWTINETVCPETYLYNKDYSRGWSDKPSFPLPATSVTCSSCLDEYNYRIYYSEESFQEEVSDMYRVFKTNSYRDLDGAWGSITDLFTDKSQLYCSTPKALWFIPTSPQRLTTNESNIYVGTGDILSVPPSLISSTLQGYGGSTYQHTRTSTEFGNFLIDDRSRKILHLADGLKEISAKGMSNFFEENLPLQLDKAVYSQTGVHYQKLYPHSHEGIGYQIAYDPKFRRVIVSKKDYKPLLPVGLIGQTVIPNKLFYDSANNIFYVWSNGRVQRVNLWDEAYFENVSFTVSYSLEFQAWSSFHSYLPNFIFNDNKTFYTSIDEGLYDHSIGNFQTYYGDKKDHILEVISNQSPSQTKVFTGLTYSAIVEDYMSTQKAYRTVQDVTFSRLIAYTQDQTTGLQDIVVKTNSFDNIIQLDGASVAAYYKDSTWYINELRDMNISHGDIPIFSSAWEDVQADYFIDKVPSLVVDQTKSLFERGRLRDKFLGVRFYFKPENNYRISTDFIDVKQKLSMR